MSRIIPPKLVGIDIDLDDFRLIGNCSMAETHRCSFAKSCPQSQNEIGLEEKLLGIGSATDSETAKGQRMTLGEHTFCRVAGSYWQRQKLRQLLNFSLRARPINPRAHEHDRSSRLQQQIHRHVSRPGIDG